MCWQDYISKGIWPHRVSHSENHQGADDDFVAFDLLVKHMQSGQGKVYIESFGLLSSNPLESL